MVKIDHVHTSLSQHTGLALVTESSVSMPSLNHNTAAVSTFVVSKRPSCVKNDNAQFAAGLTLRSRYIGEVSTKSNTRLLKVLVVKPGVP